MSFWSAIQEMGAKLKAAPWLRIVPLVLVGAASVFGYISIGYIVGHTQAFNQGLPFGHYFTSLGRVGYISKGRIYAVDIYPVFKKDIWIYPEKWTWILDIFTVYNILLSSWI